MVNVDFNIETLNHYQNSDDDLEKDLGQTCQKDFIEYGQIVTGFDTKMQSWKANKKGDEYRNLVGGLDRKRRMIHNNCLHDINIINRMAKQDGLPAFVTCDSDNPNRTDIGNAIIEQCYEKIFKTTQKAVAPEKTNSYAEKRDLMDKYNYMLDGYTKYPLVKNGKNYQFIDMFTQKTVGNKQVTAYVKGRTKDPKKLQIFQQASQMAAKSAEKELPTIDVAQADPSLALKNEASQPAAIDNLNF